ncbi:MAG: phosphoribosylglycinamide formyltransferase [Acidaminococcales bacterium]|jgi:phosphoribosylglycinamide formyltransferase-1|nr:phosphoribosylglycinamide formyltransferase [Acidaminococcales bacterium]
MADRKIGVLVSGRGSNLQALIDNIRAGVLPVKISVVISDNGAAYALARARAAGIAACVIERGRFADKAAFEKALSEKLEECGAELVAMAGFMRLLGTYFINRWPLRIMNIHPSLLPSFPGLNAQAQAIEYGAKISGCTVHFVDEGMDTGPIIIQKAAPVLGNDTEDALSARILEQEHLAYTEAIRLWAENRLEVSGRLVKIK